MLLLLLVLSGCGAATSWTKDDPSISTHVKIALLNDPQVAPYRIDAKTSGGIVTLSGTVKTQAELDRAMDVARKVKGVKDVRSELKVAPSSQLPASSFRLPASSFQLPALRSNLIRTQAETFNHQ